LPSSTAINQDVDMTDWNDYQEETAEFFRSIGLGARTNVTMKGVRTSHDVDVVVRSNHAGFDFLWLVECKHWKMPVSKLHVLALRGIVSDVGADRGILMAEKGFQSGAYEAAELTNIQLTSLTDLKASASYALGMAGLRVIQERVDQCHERYRGLSKNTRIEFSLRPPVHVFWGYSAHAVLNVADYVLNYAFSRGFPVMDDGGIIWPERTPDGARNNLTKTPAELVSWLEGRAAGVRNCMAKTPVELIESLESLINDLEDRLDVAYAAAGRKKSGPSQL
jgi:restriction system protein